LFYAKKWLENFETLFRAKLVTHRHFNAGRSIVPPTKIIIFSCKLACSGISDNRFPSSHADSQRRNLSRLGKKGKKVVRTVEALLPVICTLKNNSFAIK
jgi:hypothetical protein